MGTRVKVGKRAARIQLWEEFGGLGKGFPAQQNCPPAAHPAGEETWGPQQAIVRTKLCLLLKKPLNLHECDKF